MKRTTSIVFLAWFSVIVTSCDKVEPRLDAYFSNPAGPAYSVPRNTLSINTIELKLKGDWQLDSMSTKDTTFSDAGYIAARHLNFTDWAYSGMQYPILEDYFSGFAVKSPPIEPVMYIFNQVNYHAPDSTTLQIFNNSGPVSYTIQYKIQVLTDKQLNIVEPVLGYEWRFTRK